MSRAAPSLAQQQAEAEQKAKIEADQAALKETYPHMYDKKGKYEVDISFLKI